MDLALFLVRLVLGLGMAAHGAQKLFGWFGGYGIAGTGGFMETLGFRPGRLFATGAGLCELGAGLLIAGGFLGPVGPAMLILVMTVAALSVHARHGFFAMKDGVEVPTIYASGALLLAFAGPGSLSLDGLLGLQELSTPARAWVAVAAGILGGLLNLALRRPAPVAQPATAS